MKPLPLLLTALVCVPLHAAAPPRAFTRHLPLEAAGETSANVSIADLNGDGHPDLLLAKGRHWPLHNRILLNDGRGNFPVATNLSEAPDRTYTAALADLDGDGDLDLVVSNDRPDRKLVYRNDAGKFTIAGTFGEPAWSTRNIHLADVNGDGRPDILVANRGMAARVCLNDGRGGFPSSFALPTESTTSIVAADFDGDGFTDLAAPHRDGGRSLLLWNDGKAGFALGTPFGPEKCATRAIAAGDVNGDGRPDLVMGHETLGVFLHLNLGGRRFADGVALTGKSAAPYAIALAEMNRDGAPDVIIGYTRQPGRVLFNDGAGKNFHTVEWNDGAGAVYGLATADLDGDGWPDIAAARSDAPNGVWFSGPPAGASGWMDGGFEALPLSSLHESGTNGAWEIQKTGRTAIQPLLRVDCIGDADRAKSGANFLALSIPEETVGFEFVTVGQRARLEAGREYEAAAWVRWPDGPDAAPKDAGATSGHRSAIVSFWARHRDGTGGFAGRDEWLFDNQWRRLTFRFRATDPSHPTLVYVSLLPNQKPAATTVLLDDFDLREIPDEPLETETRTGGLALDADFAAQQPGAIAPPWHFANIGGKGITGEAVAEDSNRLFRIAMGRATSNFESAQLWQHVALSEGARYEVSCRMRWDNFTPDAPAPIVNFGIYHEATRTWFGPVDQVLERTGGWREHRFTHVPPHPGPWKLYVQLNGWGNFGSGVTVSFDDFHCKPSAP